MGALGARGAGALMPGMAALGGAGLAGLGDPGSLVLIKNMSVAIGDLRKKSMTLAETFGTTEKAKKKLDKNIKKTTETTENFISKIVRLGGKLRSVSRLFFYASLDLQQLANVILNPMRAGLAVFEDYNKTMTQMWVNFQFLSETGDASLALLEERFDELTESTEFSRLELAKAAAVFGTAGVAVEEISENLDDMAKLARVNFTTMDNMAKITLRTMRRFRVSLEEATGEMWRLSAMAQMTGENIEQVANQLGYASEMGQELGFSFQEIAASMTLLTEVYASSSLAGRRLSNVYARLLDQGEEYGVQIRDLSGEMLSQRNIIAGLADYLDLIGDPIEQNQYLMELFGRTGAASARTMVEAFKEGRLDEIMADTGDAMVDTMKELSATIKYELYVSLQDLRSEIQNLHLTIGKNLAPTIVNIIGPITTALQNFINWVDANQELIVTLGALAVAMTALAVAIKTMGFLIEIFVAIATILKVIIGPLATFVEFLSLGGSASAMLTGTISWLIPALAGLALQLIIVISVIMFIVGAIKGFIDFVVLLGEKFGWLGKVIEIVQKVIGVLIKILHLAILALITIFGVFFKLGEVVGQFFGALAGGILTLAELLGWLDELNEALDALTGFLDGVIGMAEDFLSALAPHSPSLADRIYELGDAIKSTLNPMQQATMWGRRLNNAVGDVNAEMTLGYGRATAGALLGGGGVGGQPNVAVYVDGYAIQDPEELAEIIAERQVRLSKKHYRSMPY